MSTSPDHSIITRPSPRPDLLAFEIRSKISKADIEWMASIAEGAMEAHDKIDMLIIMSNFEGSDLSATFDSYAFGVQARSLAHIRRYVVVGAPAAANAMINVSGLITPVETKTFDLKDELAAWAFLSEDR